MNTNFIYLISFFKRKELNPIIVRWSFVFLLICLLSLEGYSQELYKEKNITAGKFGIGFDLGIPLTGFVFKYNSAKFWYLSAQLLPGDGSGFLLNHNHYTFTYGHKLFENKYRIFSLTISYCHMVREERAETDDYFSSRKFISKHSHHLCLGMQYENSMSSFSGFSPDNYQQKRTPISYTIGLGYIFGNTNIYPFDTSASYYLQVGILFYFNTQENI